MCMSYNGSDFAIACHMLVNRSAISYQKTAQAFKHSDPLKSSPGSYSQSVSDSVAM